MRSIKIEDFIPLGAGISFVDYLSIWGMGLAPSKILWCWIIPFISSR
ncbi:MAG: hypothetical protein H8E71_08325 [Candidatus Marinimicrobia bacterium]|nr:hypothetical protein [Candidatus Neomarinimicrobiota bacterium]